MGVRCDFTALWVWQPGNPPVCPLHTRLPTRLVISKSNVCLGSQCRSQTCAKLVLALRGRDISVCQGISPLAVKRGRGWLIWTIESEHQIQCKFSETWEFAKVVTEIDYTRCTNILSSKSVSSSGEGVKRTTINPNSAQGHLMAHTLPLFVQGYWLWKCFLFLWKEWAHKSVLL